MKTAHIIIIQFPGGRIAVATEATEDEALGAATLFRDTLRDGKTEDYTQHLQSEGYETHCIDWTNRNFEIQI